MRSKWPSPVLFAFAAVMFFQGHEEYSRAEKLEAAHPFVAHISDPDFADVTRERQEAKLARSTGFFLQTSAEVAAAAGIVLLGYALLHSRTVKR